MLCKKYIPFYITLNFLYKAFLKIFYSDIKTGILKKINKKNKKIKINKKL